MGVCDGDTIDFVFIACAGSQGIGRQTWDHYGVNMCLSDLQTTQDPTARRLKNYMELPPSGPAFGTRDAYATNLINSNDFFVVCQTHEDFFIDGAVVKRAKDTRIHAE